MVKTPQELNLPKKFKQWWPNQGELIEKIAASPAEIFLLDAPTGVGKTVIGTATHRSRLLSQDAKDVLARFTEKPANSFNYRSIYVVGKTKQLQKQLVDNFGTLLNSVKGSLPS